MAAAVDSVPQWKKDLLARLRKQNKQSVAQCPSPGSLARNGHQPAAVASGSLREAVRCAQPKTMVQERLWENMVEENGKSDSDSSEDLSYGPGFVSKLKNKYLSRTLRETTKSRPSILRKAASMEDMLEEQPKVLKAPKIPNKYKPIKTQELKRARSVETISTNLVEDLKPKRESMHEDMLDKPQVIEEMDDKFTRRINRPKRIVPIMNEREKPPADLVKQTRLVFERKAERLKKPLSTEVAAKVDAFNSIAKKRPVLRAKPPTKPPVLQRLAKTKPEPCITIPDVSRIEFKKTEDALSETPDIILTSSPVSTPKDDSKKSLGDDEADEGIKPPPKNIDKKTNGDSDVFNFTNEKENGRLSDIEVEKNLINLGKNLQQQEKKEEKSVGLGKVKRGQGQDVGSTAVVFNFTKRQEVPDYIANDTSRVPARPERPKPGEGGIILMPGASIAESYTDEDEEVLRSLERPPSPCDVTFINDNVLIDGKSSLSQKTKKVKLSISFVESDPEIFEYPSETSILIEDLPLSPTPQVGHTVPMLSGSTLASYTPKSTEEFQLGVTRSVQQTGAKQEEKIDEGEVKEHPPIQFSSGANSDILF